MVLFQTQKHRLKEKNRIPKNKLTKLQPPTVLQRYKKYVGGKTASSTNSAGKTG